MKRIFFELLISLFLLAGCTDPSSRENINKVGDAAGQAVGEFVEGVTHGVEKAFDVSVELPSGLAERGIKFGKTSVTHDRAGTDNLLLIYMIFENDFEGEVTAKAYDNKGLEMGRTKVKISGKKDEAKFIEFHFDPHTNIDSDSKLSVDFSGE